MSSRSSINNDISFNSETSYQNDKINYQAQSPRIKVVVISHHVDPYVFADEKNTIIQVSGGNTVNRGGQFSFVFKMRYEDRDIYESWRANDWCFIYASKGNNTDWFLLGGGLIDTITVNQQPMGGGIVVKTMTISGSGWEKALRKVVALTDPWLGQGITGTSTGLSAIGNLEAFIQSLPRYGMRPYEAIKALLEGIMKGNGSNFVPQYTPPGTTNSLYDYINFFIDESYAKTWTFITEDTLRRSIQTSLYNIVMSLSNSKMNNVIFDLQESDKLAFPYDQSINVIRYQQSVQTWSTQPLPNIDYHIVPVLYIYEKPYYRVLDNIEAGYNDCQYNEMIDLSRTFHSFNRSLGDQDVTNYVYIEPASLAQNSSVARIVRATAISESEVSDMIVDNIKKHGLRVQNEKIEFWYDPTQLELIPFSLSGRRYGFSTNDSDIGNTTPPVDGSGVIDWADKILMVGLESEDFYNGSITLSGFHKQYIGSRLHLLFGDKKELKAMIESVTYSWSIDGVPSTSINYSYGVYK